MILLVPVFRSNFVFTWVTPTACPTACDSDWAFDCCCACVASENQAFVNRWLLWRGWNKSDCGHRPQDKRKAIVEKWPLAEWTVKNYLPNLKHKEHIIFLSRKRVNIKEMKKMNSLLSFYYPTLQGKPPPSCPVYVLHNSHSTAALNLCSAFMRYIKQLFVFG